MVTTSSISATPQIDWLNDVATYRATHRVTSRDPLGPLPDEPGRLDEFDALLTELRDVRAQPAERVDLGIEL